MKLYFNIVVVNWSLLFLLLLCEATMLESFVLPSKSTTHLKYYHSNQSLFSKDRNRRQSFYMSTSETSKPSDSDSTYSNSNSITITTPPFYPNSKSPLHKNTHPSPLHTIHILPSFLTPTESSKCLTISQSYAQQSSCWDQKDSKRHSSYATVDFPIEDCDALNDYLSAINFDDRLWNLIAEMYDVDVEDLSFLDFFVVHYQAKPNDNDDDEEESFVMDSLDPHRDGSMISFTIVLSESDAYEGGGTIFDALRDVPPNEKDTYNGILCDNGVIRVQNAGDAVLHSGKLQHGGNVVTKGERTVMVGFVDVHPNCWRSGVMKEACKEWGRCDVAENRFKRQQQQIKNTNYDATQEDTSGTNHRSSFNGGWKVKNDWKYNNHIGGFVPAFTSVKNRADAEKRRLRCLEAEDVCLRDLLLPREERQSNSDSSIPDHILTQFGGDVTIL